MKFLKGHFRHINTGEQLVLLVGIMFLLSAISLLLGTFLQTDIANGDIPLWHLLFRQTSDSISFFILPVLLYLYLRGHSFRAWVFGTQKADVLIYILIACMMVFSIPLVHLLAAFNASLPFPDSWQIALEFESEINGILNRLFESDAYGIVFWLFVVIAVLAPVGEEFIFRGLLVQWMNKRWSAMLSILLSAFLFSAMHMQVLGFIPRFLLGVLLGYLFYKTAMLIYSIWAHFVYNAVSFVVQEWEVHYGLSEGFASHFQGEQLWLVVLCTFLLIVSLYFFLRRLRKKEILPLS